MNPLVSIIVPCYNQAQFLPEALQSVWEQTYENWECIIVNDGSPDNTNEAAEKWVEKDSRFVYLYKENGGLSSARNAGLEIARGKYIQFLDSDDCLNSEKLSKSFNQVQNHFFNNIVVTNFKMFETNINDELQPYCNLHPDLFNYHKILYDWDFNFSIPIHCGMFSSSLFKDFRFPEKLKAKEDWVMWLTFFQKEVTTSFIDETLVFYRTHDNSMTKNVKHMLDNTMKVLEYLDEVIPSSHYKSYMLYVLKNKIERCEDLKGKVVNSNNSIGFKVEKKIRVFLKKLFQ